ncbi:NAD-dependent epimerase [Anaerosalibacter massiliensis]|uniref:NAD-dependent epimerase n=1 Tax=Anaerosalibacter massiliensis TaxID=1347392 RepID=A0A9X2S6H2_9FIRM|nr:NAD-dependent epimerase [Anaerosalibacter massiliensis]MCR2045374.1 NAD-dependent epimerase [Anaerosalibacter massiliensis]
MRNILVTGGAGFIGFNLSKRLLEGGDHVIGLDNLNDYYDVNLKKDRLSILEEYDDFKFIKASLEDKEAVDKVFKENRIDIVVNLAAQAGVRYSLKNPYAYIESNIMGFMNILEACRHNEVKHLVYASSSSVYGSNIDMPFSVHDNVDHPVSLYAATKKSNELMAHTYSHLYGIPTTGLRFFTVYGPWGRPDMALFLFTKAILNDEPIKVFNHGKMERDFTYIDDIIEGVVRVMDNPPKANEDWDRLNPDPGTSYAPFKVYNIGNNKPVQLMEFIETIEKKLGKEAKKEFLPLQAGDVPKTYADVDDLINDVGFKPDTSIDKGIGKFVEWYKKYYNI